MKRETEKSILIFLMMIFLIHNRDKKLCTIQENNTKNFLIKNLL